MPLLPAANRWLRQPAFATGPALALAAVGLLAQSARPPATSPQAAPTPKSWRGWDTYQVILWSTGDPRSPAAWRARVREAGFTAEQCPAGVDSHTFVKAHSGFYVENLVSELAFLHGRASLYSTDWNNYLATADPRCLVRKPCFDDPAFWKRLLPDLADQVSLHVHNRPLLYDLRDEPSLGSFVAPMDYCFCPFTLRAFRQWLQTQYPSLAALNREWEADFPTWDAVVPLTTFGVKARERAALSSRRPENYAPWADHRAFMDLSFAQALDRLRAAVHKRDPAVPVGIEGAQMPSAWGGYDLWRISQSVDWIEPYDLAASRAILRSFLPASAPVLATYFGADLPRLRRQAWSGLLNGDRGAIVWDDDEARVIRKSEPDMPITQRGQDLRALFDQVRQVASRLSALHPVHDPVAIHYSQASIRAHWMFDSREDGNTWLRRLSSYELTHSRLVPVRDVFLKTVEDLGLTPDFISYEQIEKGELTRQGYRVLLLPQSVAMSAAECRGVEAFVRAGGVVAADNMVATMDEHCRRLPQGQLDDLFGIRQKPGWKPAGGGSPPLAVFDASLAVFQGAVNPFADAPMVVEKKTGSGAAFYLNLDLHGPRNARHRDLFARIFHSAGVEAPVKVVAGGPATIWRYSGGSSDVVALLGEGAERVHLVLARPAQVKDWLRNLDLGARRELDLDLDPSAPVFLELKPVQ